MAADNRTQPGLLPGAETGPVSALAWHRQAIKQRLLDGATAAEVMAALTEFVDGLVRDRYQSAMKQAGEGAQVAGAQHCCLVALGGYGQRELAPYSDIDIMFLYSEEAGEAAPALFREVLHHLWNLGFQVGHSMRTTQDCVELAGQDLSIRTAMMTARFLAGSPNLFRKFHRLYAKEVIGRGAGRFIEQKKEERQREYTKFGQTIYLLEPNVKKSKGGLRDYHLLRWAGMARFQASTLQDLADRSLLSRQDFLSVTEARDFLWRVRAFLHVGAGRAQEILSFDEQVRLASLYGFEDRPNLLGVEQFMQQYYRHTVGLHETLIRFIDRCQAVTAKRRSSRAVPSDLLDGYFSVTGRRLTVPFELRARLLDSPELLLRLFQMAGSRRLKIEADLVDEIHSHMDSVSSEAFRTPEASRVFLKILSGPGAVAATLEAMHRAHLLEKLIPVFATLRGLMQFNQYHKYTVDEHSLLAVGKAEALAMEPGVMGVVYQEIRRKDLLHLAILLHDLGKGRKEDHCEVGKAIAEETAARLGCDQQESRTLMFLVHRHLIMSHTAFRRDPYDEKVLVPFAQEVVTPEVLRMMLILTAADIAAVGPGLLTKWKESLLIELYLRTLRTITGEQDDKMAGPNSLKRLTREVAQEFKTLVVGGLGWIESQLDRFPLRYLHGTQPKRIAAHLEMIARLQAGDVLVEGIFNEELGTCEFTVITHDTLTPGIFSKTAGVMAAQGLEIFDAQIITRNDGVVVNTFQASDPDFAGAPPVERLADVAETIVRVLKGAESVEQLRSRKVRLFSVSQPSAERHVSEVLIDNKISDRFTVIDVFAADTQGLLYVITDSIFRLGLSVQSARISTRLDDDIQPSLRTGGRHEVVDVFYVTDQHGAKIADQVRLEAICSTMKQDIDRYMNPQVDAPESVSSGSAL
ncbi:MAG: Bifunctional uridylyltransferase/uridylyl-removing enzyme [Nitrospira sp.]|nr:Bifunctional uridylyltransferase/uridylyl-removing enzyme [Nitrospira sp.]